jgi:hypothetical protein
MYAALLAQFQFTLANLDAILAKAEAHAESRSFPVDNFMALRLAPDMLPFWRQVTIACDVAKAAAAAYARIDAPKFEDNETTVAQLRERIAKTLAFLATISPEQYTIADDDVVRVPFPPGKAMLARDAALSRSVPNFFFHVSMAYAILRAGGVNIGKMDYLGPIKLFDA